MKYISKHANGINPNLVLLALWLFIAVILTSFPANAAGESAVDGVQKVLDKATRQSPFFRGLLLPILHGPFMLISLSFGLWCYKMTSKMKTLWALPAAWLVGTSVAAITCNLVVKGGWSPFESSFLRMLAPSLSPFDALTLTYAVFFGLLIIRGIVMAPAWSILVTLILGAYSGIIFASVYGDPRANVMYAIGTGITFGFFAVVGIGVGHIFDGVRLQWIPVTLGYLSIFLAFLTLIEIS